MKQELEKIRNLPLARRRLLLLAGLIVGMLIGAFVAFNFNFLSHVLPHGGF